MLIDPTGMSADWFENELTGDVYYNSEMKKGDEGTGAMEGEGWKHMGENNMFSNGYVGSSDYALVQNNEGLATSSDISVSGDGVTMEAMFEGDNAQTFMGNQGYDLVPTQQTIFDKESTSFIPGPRSNGNTIIYGQETRITEKVGYVSQGSMEIGKIPLENTVFKTNFMSLSQVNRYQITYTQDNLIKFATKVNNLSQQFSGTHDYKMKTTLNSWNSYSGNNRLINKFVNLYGTE